MRFAIKLATPLLTLALAACSGIETRPAPIDTFAAAGYSYYDWRSDPLPGSGDSQDPMYIIDPILRSEVDANLSKKGYVRDRDRAQFTVDYVYASGLRIGEQYHHLSQVG